MRLTKNQIQFIVNCDVEEMAHMLQEDYGISVTDALDKIYNSALYKKLADTRTGLYIQSPEYQYGYLKEELQISLQPHV